MSRRCAGVAPSGTREVEHAADTLAWAEGPIGGVDLIGRVGPRLGLDGRCVIQLERELKADVPHRHVVDERRRQAPLQVGLDPGRASRRLDGPFAGPEGVHRDATATGGDADLGWELILVPLLTILSLVSAFGGVTLGGTTALSARAGNRARLIAGLIVIGLLAYTTVRLIQNAGRPIGLTSSGVLPCPHG